MSSSNIPIKFPPTNFFSSEVFAEAYFALMQEGLELKRKSSKYRARKLKSYLLLYVKSFLIYSYYKAVATCSKNISLSLINMTSARMPQHCNKKPPQLLSVVLSLTVNVIIALMTDRFTPITKLQLFNSKIESKSFKIALVSFVLRSRSLLSKTFPRSFRPHHELAFFERATQFTQDLYCFCYRQCL